MHNRNINCDYRSLLIAKSAKGAKFNSGFDRSFVKRYRPYARDDKIEDQRRGIGKTSTN